MGVMAEKRGEKREGGVREDEGFRLDSCFSGDRVALLGLGAWRGKGDWLPAWAVP